ncbi:MAG TPA: RHS repeat-associated core domain-containing protein, partial [Chloroflexota bacterium]|nr:RHS repeat-associated core domain-containing protein [Chloroflexota bacterium]
GTRRYYHGDALGSTRVVTDDAGNPVSAYSYDAYGAVRAQAGEGRGFTYTGEQLDTETSLVFLRARYYDPQTGRFLSRDTIAADPTNSQDLNRYGYVRGNPTSRVDPTGHWVETGWDVLNVGWDYYEYQKDPSLLNAAALVVDTLAAVVPFVPGGAGLTVRAGKVTARLAERAADVGSAATCAFAKHGGTGAGGVEGVEEVLKALENNGVTVVTGPEASRYVGSGEAAAWITTRGKPGVLFVGEHAEYGDVLHEARHFGQDRAVGFPGNFSAVQQAEREIAAYEYELRNAVRWGYTEEAIQNVYRQIEKYRRMLDE